MLCLHPHCPSGNGLSSWEEVVNDARLKIRNRDKPEVLNLLGNIGTLDHSVPDSTPSTTFNTSAFKRILQYCPCLFAQLRVKVTPSAVVHLCEITLGSKITSETVFDAFLVQHPSLGQSYRYRPKIEGAGGGDIMEKLCCEVLENHGIPEMKLDDENWPDWSSKGHISLNSGKMTALKLYGDILIPCAPHNLLVSIKSEAARERFVVSGNRLESVGFGFFNDASEFWTKNRMNQLKRWGFSAVYMPRNTLAEIEEHLEETKTKTYSTNINGRPLFRPLDDFGSDIARVAGRLSMDL